MDDMVQDTVDALSWVHKNIVSFGGDQVINATNIARLMLIK